MKRHTANIQISKNLEAKIGKLFRESNRKLVAQFNLPLKEYHYPL